jgi:hypothetical protein
MAGLDPAIHVDPRVKPGGDDKPGMTIRVTIPEWISL